MEPVIVIGAGLAGSEAAWQLAQRGIPVTLCEMKPAKRTPAHQSDDFAELVLMICITVTAIFSCLCNIRIIVFPFKKHMDCIVKDFLLVALHHHYIFVKTFK